MMQTIRSRFLTVICGVSLTLTLVFGSLCVFLVDRSETEIAAKTLTGRAIHASTTLNPIFMQSEDIVHYIGHTIEHEVKNPQDLRKKANRDRLEAMIRQSFYNAATGTASRAITSITMKTWPTGRTASGIPARMRVMILCPSPLPPSWPIVKLTRAGRYGIISPCVRRKPCGRHLTSMTIMVSA